MTPLTASEDFAEWYREQSPRLVGALVLATASQDTAEDLAAGAFAKALSRWGHLRETGQPTGWLYRVAFNDLRSRWRRETNEQFAWLRLASRPAVPSPPPSLPTPEIWEAVQALPDRMRVAVALRYVADLSEKEIASTMDIDRGTVASTLSRARRVLATQLAEHRTTGIDSEEPSCSTT